MAAGLAIECAAEVGADHLAACLAEAALSAVTVAVVTIHLLVKITEMGWLA